MTVGSTVYLSHLAWGELKNHLKKQGHKVVEVSGAPFLGKHVASHADLVICKTSDGIIRADPALLSETYPGDARYCALFLDRYMLHRLGITAPELLEKARLLGLELINVRQGYTRCSAAVVDGGAVITADRGIAAALEATDVKVLTVSEGHVALPGYPFGFIGGACGRVGGELVFNGDLTSHPDFGAIKAFAEARGIRLRYFPSCPLTDIGSIIEE